MYAADAGIEPGKDHNSRFDVPLVKWIHPSNNPPTGRTSGNCYVYAPNKQVSDGDRNGIKYIYPWEGP